MKVLILGGTRFLGRTLAEVCVTRGHEVTLFHRGRSAASELDGVTHVLGDRNVSLDAVREVSWDVIFDPSAYEVPQVRAAASLSASLYVFVSSISVYSDLKQMVESGPVQ